MSGGGSSSTPLHSSGAPAAAAAQQLGMSELEVPYVPFSSLCTDPSLFAHQLANHGFVVLTEVPHSISAPCQQADRAADDFFALEPDSKRACVNSNQASLCGYRETAAREHLHMRLDLAPTVQRWPDEQTRDSFMSCAAALENVAQQCIQAVLSIDSCAALPPSWAMFEDLGPSVLDAFLYTPASGDDTSVALESHTDPGFFTVEGLASCCGLQMRARTGEWRTVEPMLNTGDLVVFGGDSLRQITANVIKGSWHRVLAASVPRRSVVYELRLPSTK